MDEQTFKQKELERIETVHKKLEWFGFVKEISYYGLKIDDNREIRIKLRSETSDSVVFFIGLWETIDGQDRLLMGFGGCV